MNSFGQIPTDLSLPTHQQTQDQTLPITQNTLVPKQTLIPPQLNNSITLTAPDHSTMPLQQNVIQNVIPRPLETQQSVVPQIQGIQGVQQIQMMSSNAQLPQLGSVQNVPQTIQPNIQQQIQPPIEDIRTSMFNEMSLNPLNDQNATEMLMRMQMMPPMQNLEQPPTLPELPVFEDTNYPTVGQPDLKTKKCLNKELVRDKDGRLFYCYTYLVKNKAGEEHEQKVYIKKSSSKARQPKTPTDGNRYDEKVVVEDKERKMTKQHGLLLQFINAHIEQIKTYNKFVVSRVLQDVKREQPDSRVSYGLVKKVLEQQHLLPAKKTYYKLD
ncbi:hypothetical protein EIN_085410 [Entamoeba invadens IP1]|uniref:hypothetical protein n=1 Tax=Entamoeba invadens IP1 TaxID=370355 RepID=UPI0002C3ECF6|nr:hypothetical protein EIN_085410 [Entamoeba invadens IP1]ELP85309.1 hypothetical protein EIN_085410 [Entamoeba invadens IP1]|eukprot:XP_004184655.1 hypothetical protein EIN_085410 [Entamoeba invadens IP1]